MEDVLRTSGLDFTIVRPSRVVDDPAITYAVAVERGLVPGKGAKVSKHAIALFIADALARGEYIGKAVAVAS
jgi:hypothetical protein